MRFSKRVRAWIGSISATRWAVIFLILGLLVSVIGYINLYCTDLCEALPASPIWFANLVKDFYSNLALTLIGTAITVLIIDGANERRSGQLLKAQLIREMGHPTDNSVTLRAIRELSAHGWLIDGTLRSADLYSANLREANLTDADLTNARLMFANLNEAKLINANLQGCDVHSATFVDAILFNTNFQGATGLTHNGKVSLNAFAATAVMRGVVFPNGDRYDGCLNLYLDISDARSRNIDLQDPQAMASFYGVTQEQYEKGQRWYQANKAALEKEINEQKPNLSTSVK